MLRDISFYYSTNISSSRIGSGYSYRLIERHFRSSYKRFILWIVTHSDSSISYKAFDMNSDVNL